MSDMLHCNVRYRHRTAHHLMRGICRQRSIAAMNVALLILSRICFVWILTYLVFSAASGFWAGARHGEGLLLLEFQSRRARGSREVARARILKRMALSALFALPVAVASLIASAAMS
ncbi:hypothetical protein [Burkholderia sp. Bp9012]|uniref:hypothetical protein n=1 Tax=Burkholderia sp. Bp9012 TaxID=2184562 RepID=UPI000F59B891|nr:hypothetical protein [Burkholderia sp. Bp9012]